ncbi:hypothetical protein HC251_24230 [Iamia sp. SCSIO 61187]|uniref:SCO7613 C-terminal domain-containing membrane protein n=1 Tax=Iamia sp. SCSIO 61187 TaxID=2722752 RepID=UPI001C63A2B0|nr:hypothetical protein [Iamia sp. SCSIO 61187]QYG95230.1 hypothetical protein HC251_24230 [Iamia sp. SCSIO 61187]
MPRTVSFPPPSATTCPICSDRLSATRCDRCGATFSGPDGETLWRVDHDLFDLCRIRNDLVRRLLTDAEAPAAPASGPAPRPSVPTPSAPEPTRGHDRGPASVPGPAPAVAPPPAPAAPWSPAPVGAPTAVPPLPGAPTSAPTAAAAATTAPPTPPSTSPPSLGRPRPSFTAAEVLVGLGALSLVAAVAVFAAVSWSDLAAWAQGALVVGLTGVIGAGAVACRRRDLVATAESLGAVTVALALADVQVARVGLDGVVPAQWAWVGGLALVAGGTIAAGRRTGIRTLALAGTALAFVPLVLAAGDQPMAVVAALALQAVGAGVLTVRLADRRLDRAVVAVGAAGSWLTAVAGALVVAGAGLATHPVAHPVGPAAVLAALAIATLAAVRRQAPAAEVDELTGDAPRVAEVVDGAGVALAFVPALLLAVGTGSPTVVVATLAVQALVALAASTVGLGVLSRAQTAVAGTGGPVCWVAAAAGGLVLALDQVGDRAPGTTPWVSAVVLAVLAAATITLARRAATMGRVGSVGRGQRPQGRPPARAATGGDPTADLLGAAGTALALAPALLVAAEPWSATTFLAVAAVQAVVALGLAGRDGLLTVAERGVATVGGWALWSATALGTVVLTVAEITGGDPVDRFGALAVMAGLSGASIAVGTVVRRTDVVAAGTGLAFLPVVLAVVDQATPSLLVAVLIGEALAAALLASLVEPRRVRSVLVAGGATAWVAAVAGATLLGLAGWLDTPAAGPAGSVALLAALAALAVGAALAGADRPSAAVGLGAAVVPVLLGVALAAGGLEADGWVAAVLAGAAVVALGAAALSVRDPERPWAAPVGVALVAAAALAVVPAMTVLTVVAALVERATEAPGVGADVVVVDWLRPALERSGADVPGGATVVQLLAVAGVVGAVGLLRRRVGRALGVLVGVAALAVVPVAAGLTVAATVAGLGVVVLAVGTVVRLRPRDPELLVAAGVVALLGTAVAVASTPWAIGWTVLVGVVVSALAVEQVLRRSPDASVWVGAALGVVLGGVALDAWVLEAPGPSGPLAVALAAAVASPIAAVLERRGEAGAAVVVDVMVAVALAGTTVAALGVGSVLELSPFVAVVGVTAAGAALRPSRRPAWLVATAAAVVLGWIQTGRAEVDVIEAYTVPLAAWALLVGGVVGARRGLGSWERFGVGLVAAAGPTTVLALVDPDPVRTVAVVALGTAAAVWGAAARLQAPLAIGATAVGVLAVRHLGPVSVELPRYVTFAVAGLVLLAVGATFEQRRQDLRQARDAFTRLR